MIITTTSNKSQNKIKSLCILEDPSPAEREGCSVKSSPPPVIAPLVVDSSTTTHLVTAMPWFRKSHSSSHSHSGKKRGRNRITKDSISLPTDFKHCYHMDAGGKDGYTGLPPEWSSAAQAEKSKSEQNSQFKTAQISQENEASTDFSTKQSPVSEKGNLILLNGSGSDSDSGDNKEISQKRNNSSSVPDAPKSSDCKSSSSSTTTTTTTSANNNRSNRASIYKEWNARNLSARSLSNKSSNSSTENNDSNNTGGGGGGMGLTKRPSPIVRGKDTNLEDTIWFIRKHCESMSNESIREDELQTSSQHSQQSGGHIEREPSARGRFRSRTRPESLMQLRSSPINRKNVVSFTSSSSTSAMLQAGDQNPSSAFCLSAPSEVIQSDLGLYALTNGSESKSSISQYRISSPNGSSGYFGSNASSLFNAKLSSSSGHQIAAGSSGSSNQQSIRPNSSYGSSTSSSASSSHQQPPQPNSSYGLSTSSSASSSHQQPPQPNSSYGLSTSSSASSSHHQPQQPNSSYSSSTSSSASSSHHQPQQPNSSYSSSTGSSASQPQQPNSSYSSSSHSPSDIHDSSITDLSETISSQSNHYMGARFHSLQRRPNYSNSGTGTGLQHGYSYRNTASKHSNGGGGGVGHYGTTPRSHKIFQSVNTHMHCPMPETGSATGNTTGSVYRKQERAERDYYDQPQSQRYNRPDHRPVAQKSSSASMGSPSTYGGVSSTTGFPSTGGISSAGYTGGGVSSTTTLPSTGGSVSNMTNSQKRERQTSQMSSEKFRATLELLVNPTDPRKQYKSFVKIGEGSTGLVYTARHIASNKVVAVKKMNLWTQQRRELLFNEVSDWF